MDVTVVLHAEKRPEVVDEKVMDCYWTLL